MVVANMTELPIKKFGQKLMASSEALNKMEDHYLTRSENARIKDGGITPRKGRQRFSQIDTPNVITDGAFVLNKNLYQIYNNSIFQLLSDGTRQQVGNISGGGGRTDILTFQKTPDEGVAVIADSSGTLSVFDGTNSGVSVANKIKIAKLKYSNYEPDENAPAVTTGSYITNSGDSPGIGAVGYVRNWNKEERTLTLGMQTERAEFQVGDNLSIFIDSTAGSFQVFTSVVSIEYTIIQGSIIENALGHSWWASGHTLYISAPLMEIEDAYNFTGQNAFGEIAFKYEILGLRETMNGLYIFTEDLVYYLDQSDIFLQGNNVVASARPLGDGGVLMHNHLSVPAGNKIFYLTKGLNINTINYLEGTDFPGIGELSERPLIGLKSLLETIDENQPYGYAFYNEKEKLVQFYIRTIGSTYNDICIGYDITNDTWNIDTNRNYTNLIDYQNKIYGFTGLNQFGDISNIVYIDNIGTSDKDTFDSSEDKPINFKIITQKMLVGSTYQKLFTGYYLKGRLSENSNLIVKVFIDGYLANTWNLDTIQFSGNSYWQSPIENAEKIIVDFDSEVGSLRLHGDRISFEISSSGVIQDFLFDTLGTKFMNTGMINRKFRI